MAIIESKIRDKIKNPDYKEFICDTESDVADLPGLDECCMGSTAFIIEGSLIYMLNSKGKWVQV